MFAVSPLPLSLALLLAALVPNAFAIPQPDIAGASSSGLSMNLVRRSSRSAPQTEEEVGIWAKNHHDRLVLKYGGQLQQVKRRGSGTNLMVNQNYDSSFYGSLAVGTPSVSYNVILDTGSADLWVASSTCLSCDITFNANDSSTFSTSNTPFSITYGLGDASGILGTDVIQMAGFSVPNQQFGVCNNVDDVLQDPVAGLLGLGFQTISASGATPFWETLVKNGAWDSPVMTFQLTRYSDDAQASSLEPGGTFTMGFTNTSLFTGNIDFHDIPNNDVGFWLQSLSSLTVQGNAITLGSATDNLAAIDTGTTAVGGPSQFISEIYAQIPGSAPGSGNFQNYYTYPCSTSVNVTLAFGGQSWAINSADFQLQQLNNNLCLGAFFELSTGSAAPPWIIGDTFLKNVYTVFQYNPPAVGFAQLSDYALSLNDNNNIPVPSATIGSVIAQVSATRGTRESNASGPRNEVPGLSALIVLVMFLRLALS